MPLDRIGAGVIRPVVRFGSVAVYFRRLRLPLRAKAASCAFEYLRARASPPLRPSLTAHRSFAIHLFPFHGSVTGVPSGFEK
jgi:hypothetical protein